MFIFLETPWLKWLSSAVVWLAVLLTYLLYTTWLSTPHYTRYCSREKNKCVFLKSYKILYCRYNPKRVEKSHEEIVSSKINVGERTLDDFYFFKSLFLEPSPAHKSLFNIFLCPIYYSFWRTVKKVKPMKMVWRRRIKYSVLYTLFLSSSIRFNIL